MKWQIEYISKKVAENILNFPDGILARYLRLTDLMMEFGPNLGHPHTKSVDKGLFKSIYHRQRRWLVKYWALKGATLLLVE